MISGIATVSGQKNFALIGPLLIIGFLIGILAYGYLFKIMKSSFAGLVEPPEFNSLSEIYIDGIKVVIINFIYMIPTILMIPGLVLHIGILTFIATLYMVLFIPVVLMALTNMVENEGEISVRPLNSMKYLVKWEI